VEGSEIQVLSQVLVILGVSCVVTLLFHWARIPVVIGFLATGIIIGPKALAWVTTTPGANAISEIALSLLLFTIGLEFNLARLRSLKRSLLFLGAPQVILCVAAFSAFAGIVFDFGFSKAVFVGFLLALSSTAIVLKVIEEKRDFNTPYAQNAVGILIFQDLAVLVMILLVPMLAEGGKVAGDFRLSAIFMWLGKAVGSIVGFYLLSRFILNRLLFQVVQTRSREVFFFFLLFLSAGCGFILHSIGLSFALGAFVAGVLVADSPYEKQASADFAPLRDIFVGFFFISIGMLLDPVFAFQHFHWILLFLAILFTVKSSIIVAIGRLNKFPKSISIMTGVMLFQVGEFSFVLAKQGVDLDLISPHELQYFLSLSIVSLALTPYAYKYGPKLSFQDRFESWIPQKLTQVFRSEKRRDPTIEIPIPHEGTKEVPYFQTLIIGFGIAGQNLASALKNLEIPYQILEANAQTVQSFKAKGEPIHFGDATRREILEEAGVRNCKLVVVMVSGVNIIEAILSTIRQVRPDVKIVVRTAYVRDVDTIRNYENVEWAVGEIETALEILSRTLRAYGVGSEKIHSFLMESRESILKDKGDWMDHARRNLEIPTWEALSAMRPFRIEENMLCVSKTLAEIDLRARSQAGVVVIFREGFGTRLPSPDYLIEVGDVLYLLGTDAAVESAQDILTKAD